jgi:hypothetical protein
MPAETIMISPTDTLTGIITGLLERDVKVIPTDKHLIHYIFFGLRKDSNLLKAFTFDTQDMYPYSATLDEAFENIQVGDDLERKNPAMAFFDIKPTIKQYFDEVLKGKFNERQIEELGRISGELASKLSAGATIINGCR